MARAIAMFLYPGGQSLDITGPMEVFALANRQWREEHGDGEDLYHLHYVSQTAGPVRMASELVIHAQHSLADYHASLDTLLISGGMGDAARRVGAEIETLRLLRAHAARARRVASVCSGALVLAACGLLDGRRATTHWSDIASLSQYGRDVNVVPDAIYVRDGKYWSSAGITAGIDLALAMLAEDHGMSLALKVAKRMVMYTKRSGGQKQFSQQLELQHSPDQFAALIQWLQEHLAEAIDVGQMAERMHLSERHFRRIFQSGFQCSPRQYLNRLRVEAAKALLENTNRELKLIAQQCGFGQEENLRRHFQRELGIKPLEYRRRFSSLLVEVTEHDL